MPLIPITLKKEWIFGALFVAAFVAAKIPDLTAPAFWDEAWSYLPAISEMANSGPSLMPNAIDPELYRGHPLLFYFIFSTVSRWTAGSLLALKLGALLITILYAWRLFQFAARHFGVGTASFTVLLLPLQSVFFVQSSLVLPEMLLALFTLLAMDSYLRNKRVYAAFWLTAALYTKESALVIWGVLFCLELLRLLHPPSPERPQKPEVQPNRARREINGLLILLVPVLLAGGFFVAQKWLVGWYLFPDHVSFIRADAVADRLLGYLRYLISGLGRALILGGGLIAYGVLFFNGLMQNLKARRAIGVTVLFIVGYLLFSSLNFYSPRYLLSMLPLLLVVAVHGMWKVASGWKRGWIWAAGVLFIAMNFTTLASQKTAQDHSLGYRHLVRVHREMVEACEQMQLTDKPIVTHFLMKYYMTRPDLGYLKQQRGFTHVSTGWNPAAEYAIVSSCEFDDDFYIKVQQHGALLHRFQSGTSWCELYRLGTPTDRSTEREREQSGHRLSN